MSKFPGLTDRVKVLFGVLLGATLTFTFYGANYCLNVVTEPEGTAAAVLIRAVETHGANGPGKPLWAFQIDKRHYGLDLCSSDSDICGLPVRPRFAG